MEVSITDISEIEKEIQIKTNAFELAPHFEEAYKKQQAAIEIKGFRKGRAPLEIVKRIYGESIEYNSLDTIASNLYKQAITERNIYPIGEPVLTDIDYKRGDMLTFKIKYEIKPNFELKEYKKIPAERLIHHVTEKEIQDELLRLQKANSKMIPADISADSEHVVTGDVQQLDRSGSPLIGKKNTDTRFYLASETLLPEIKDTLINKKIGDVCRVNFEHKDGESSKDEHFEITINKIEKVLIPELNDDLIKKITKDKVLTLIDFRQQIRKDLEIYWHDLSERKLLDLIIGEIVRKHDFTVPNVLIKGVLDSLVDELKNQQPNKKLPSDFDEETFRENNRGYAVYQAKWFLIQEQIIEIEKITVEESDLDHLAEIEAPKFGIEKDRLIQFYKSSKAVKDRMLQTKLTDLLKQNAVITDRITEEQIN